MLCCGGWRGLVMNIVGLVVFVVVWLFGLAWVGLVGCGLVVVGCRWLWSMGCGLV